MTELLGFPAVRRGRKGRYGTLPVSVVKMLLDRHIQNPNPKFPAYPSVPLICFTSLCAVSCHAMIQPVFLLIYSSEVSTMIGKGRKVGFEPKKRQIEVRIISAQDLQNVKRIGKMRTYAVVYIDPNHKVTTHVDEEEEINPTWNQKLVLEADDQVLSNILAALNVDIYARGHIREKLVGTARILLSEVLKGGDAANPSDNPIQCFAVPVRRPSGRPQGILNVWIPPTGEFLLHRDSLSLSRRDDVRDPDAGDHMDEFQARAVAEDGKPYREFYDSRCLPSEECVT